MCPNRALIAVHGLTSLNDSFSISYTREFGLSFVDIGLVSITGKYRVISTGFTSRAGVGVNIAAS